MWSRTKSFARRWWHQLTSMRTALLLLLALALASIPGSVFPQRTIAPEKVNAYYLENPDLAPWLDRIWFFDVYSSPWFSAIYLLLMVSLIGCITPRMRDIIRQLRQRVPDAPSRMSILPFHRKGASVPTQEAARKALKSERWRTTVHEKDGATTIAAEKGYLREVGNLAFHISLVGILVGMAMSSFFTWYGYRILSEGPQQAFCNNLQQYDEYGLGPYVDENELPAFCLELQDFRSEFQKGQPTQFEGDIRWTHDGEEGDYTIRVNHPLSFDGTNVFLIGQGYTPVATYTDKYGASTTIRAPFLPDDAAMNSQGALKFPDVNIDPETGEADTLGQVGFEATLVPTFDPDTEMLLGSEPELNNPVLALNAFRGDLGMDTGLPQSVYTLDEGMMEKGLLEPVDGETQVIGVGDTYTLDDGSTLTFDGVEQYAVLQVRYDPSQGILLGTAILLMVSLVPMLAVRRRRFWVRFNADGTVEYGGLTKTEYDGFPDECAELITDIAPEDDKSSQPTGSESKEQTS
ncbi:cytochrome c biogenesis protein ResB [Salininema proteolyticum]|uniref:Cytochrome c biogenesis protein ResB n=1 Tax=Salininema proteolyticum TaxID=1607685 RepID=A0ABV8TWA0_9ACTN